MTGKCHYPGCSNSFHKIFKENLSFSIYRVPTEQKEAVAEFLGIQTAPYSPLRLCTAHFESNALIKGGREFRYVTPSRQLATDSASKSERRKGSGLDGANERSSSSSRVVISLQKVFANHNPVVLGPDGVSNVRMLDGDSDQRLSPTSVSGCQIGERCPKRRRVSNSETETDSIRDFSVTKRAANNKPA